jgi:hypothetical protein
MELILLSRLRGLSWREVLYEPVLVLQVSLRETIPCLVVVLCSLPPTFLEELVFLVLHYYVVLAYLFVPVPKLG